MKRSFNSFPLLDNRKPDSSIQLNNMDQRTNPSVSSSEDLIDAALLVDSDLEDAVKQLGFPEQLSFSRISKTNLAACIQSWTPLRSVLDFDEMLKDISKEDLLYFIDVMRSNLHSVNLKANKLQEYYALLEEAGATVLSGVSTCQMEGRSVTKYLQWPMYALPKFLPNVTQLSLDIDVNINFIDAYRDLSLLCIRGNITQSAVDAVFQCCKKLQNFQLLQKCESLNLKEISLCENLRQVSLHITNFCNSSFRILRIMSLKDLIISRRASDDASLGEWLNAIKIIIITRCKAMSSLTVDALGHPNGWLEDIRIEKCIALQYLGLVNCDFRTINVEELEIPNGIMSLGFNNCEHLTDMQLLTFVKKLPELSSLTIVSCPLLTQRVLHEILNHRHSDVKRAFFKFKVRVHNCNDIEEQAFRKNPQYWSSQSLMGIEGVLYTHYELRANYLRARFD